MSNQGDYQSNEVNAEKDAIFHPQFMLLLETVMELMIRAIFVTSSDAEGNINKHEYAWLALLEATEIRSYGQHELIKQFRKFRIFLKSNHVTGINKHIVFGV